jgi:hypothetical protein
VELSIPPECFVCQDPIQRSRPERQACRPPGPAPALGDPAGTKYYEIPIAVQDRSFNTDGSLFYPDNRAFFEGLNQPPTPPYLDIPFIPDQACDSLPSDIAPIFNPEFFGNTMVVNGKTWPYLVVEQRRYRFRFLNGCNSRRGDDPGCSEALVAPWADSASTVMYCYTTEARCSREGGTISNRLSGRASTISNE